MFKAGLFTFNAGDRVTCTIRNQEIHDAVIHLISYETEAKAWICHNDSNCIGSESPKMWGYNYSWVFTLRSDGRTTEDVKNLKPEIGGLSMKEKVSIDIEIQHFLRTNGLEKMFTLFRYKFGIFDEFECYEMGEGDGCIKLKNDRKSVEIKLSRFIRQMANKNNDLAITNHSISKLDVDDKTIETIHNKFVSYQKGGTQIICFLSGEDILNGYKKSNYLNKEIGTIHKSCMVDRLDFLKIYSQNPNQVELAVIYIDSKIAARCFVWTATDGKKYSDRVYYCYDWLESLMKEKLRKMEILPINEQSFKSVQLEKWEFEYYPYADNFYYLDRKTGLLVSFQSNNFNQLRNTNGGIGN